MVTNLALFVLIICCCLVNVPPPVLKETPDCYTMQSNAFVEYFQDI